MMKSKIIIGHVSILREAFMLKKVLSCNLTGHKDVKFQVKFVQLIKILIMKILKEVY